jgi:hypothetical protein
VQHVLAAVRRCLGVKTKAAAFTGAGVVGGTGLGLLGFGLTEAMTFGAVLTTTLFKLFPSPELAQPTAQQAKEPMRQPKASSALRHGRPHPRRPLVRGLRSFAVRRVRRTAR